MHRPSRLLLALVLTAAASVACAARASAAPLGAQPERFVTGDYALAPASYDAVGAATAGAAEFSLLDLPWMVAGDFRSVRYAHTGGDVGSDVAGGRIFVPSFEPAGSDIDARAGLKIADPRLFIGAGYVLRNANAAGAAFPAQPHGASPAFDKLPDLERPLPFHGSLYAFPAGSTIGAQSLGNAKAGTAPYRVLKYDMGGTVGVGKTRVYLNLGYLGERDNPSQDVPSAQSATGPYAGLGIHF
jgi:hypothetical protein